ncbi:MAG TPA: glycosyltransferase family 9 protein [Pyrinomonadaceae bacterium]|nr:glycosyltransferase family 9 protein [Pyrinomonadaceae bacterium]
MTEKLFEPQNILVIHFGQMGDVILALPAMQAIRQKFPNARLTALLGKSSAMIARLADVFDEEIIVDRVELRDGNKLRSINQIRRIVREVRRRKFDFIVDLHSLSETNLLGFLSGARKRLYANRENRSLDFLAKFPAKPPAEDKSKHISERYLDVLAPLGIENIDTFAHIAPRAENLEEIEKLFRSFGIKEDETLIGLFPGAGHPSRRWSLENFARLAEKLLEKKNCRVLVFLGPEEADLAEEIERKFPPETIVLKPLKLLTFFAAVSKMRIFISNDTGPMHLAAIAGAAVVLILDERAPDTFLPLTKNLRVVKSGEIGKISVDEVFQATGSFLDNELTKE